MQTISPRIRQLYTEFQAEGPDAVENFWHEVTGSGTPLIEPLDDDKALVTFVWRGQATSTSVAWGVDLALERFRETDLWYGSQVLPADLRTIYYFCHDGASAVPRHESGAGPTHIDPNAVPYYFPRDPSDPTDYNSWASILELPGAAADPWSSPRADVPRGSVTEEKLESAALGGTRNVAVYCPPGVPTDGLPVLVIFDGYLGRTLLSIPTTVDNLIAAGKIPPLVALFVDGVEELRERDLRPTQPIVDFTTRELMPWARRRWRLGTDPRDCVIAGASLGGLTAAYVALRAPEDFGAVLAQSGSFWWPKPQEGEPEWLIREYAKQPQAPLRFYLDVGDRETGPGPGGAPAQVLVNREMRDTLRDRGYPVTYAEYAGAHDYINWRRTFADGLIALFTP